MVWCGVVWCSVVWCGVVWCGVVWCGVVWCGYQCIPSTFPLPQVCHSLLEFIRNSQVNRTHQPSSANDPRYLPQSVVWCGVVWCGVVWCGVVWCGMVRCGVVWCGVVWCSVVWCGVVRCGVVWCGVVSFLPHLHHYHTSNLPHSHHGGLHRVHSATVGEGVQTPAESAEQP